MSKKPIVINVNVPNPFKVMAEQTIISMWDWEITDLHNGDKQVLVKKDLKASEIHSLKCALHGRRNVLVEKVKNYYRASVYGIEQEFSAGAPNYTDAIISLIEVVANSKNSLEKTAVLNKVRKHLYQQVNVEVEV